MNPFMSGILTGVGLTLAVAVLVWLFVLFAKHHVEPHERKLHHLQLKALLDPITRDLEPLIKDSRDLREEILRQCIQARKDARNLETEIAQVLTAIRKVEKRLP